MAIIERLQDRLRRAITNRTPTIIGPWTEEVGYELFYWIPFVRWVVESLQIPREQLFVISREGTSSWYGDLAYRYADVFSFVTFDEWQALAKAHLDAATHIFAELNQPFLVFDAKIGADKLVRKMMKRLGWQVSKPQAL